MQPQVLVHDDEVQGEQVDQSQQTRCDRQSQTELVYLSETPLTIIVTPGQQSSLIDQSQDT